MARVTFDEEQCKGCTLCTTVCPKNIITIADRINSNGYKPAFVENMDSCIGCGFCATICPDVVITVEK